MRSFLRQPVVWICMGALLLGAVVISLIVVFRPKPPISSDIQKKLNFSAMVPGGAAGYTVKAETVSYNASANTLQLHVVAGNQNMAITEQASPAVFTDIPQYYTALIDKLHSYSTFESTNGTVALTHPTELNGAQSAVMNGKGVLMFVRPTHDMSDDDWRKFFDSLQGLK